MMRASLLTALLAATAITAHAQPTITVDDSVPFTAKDLADAVEIRVRDTNERIHIARSGDLIVITVGDRARALKVDNAAPHDLARVVALVIVSLADAPTVATAPLVPTPPPATPPAPPAMPLVMHAPTDADVSPTASIAAIAGPTVLFGSQRPALPAAWTLRVSLGWHAEQGGEDTVEDGGAGVLATAMVSRRLTSYVHILLGASAEQTHRMTALANQGAHTLFSAKGGVEFRHRWFAFEAGVSATRLVLDCNVEEPAVSFDPYGAARMYLMSVGAFRNRLFVEAGVKRVSTTSACIGVLRTMGVDRPSSVTTVHGAIGIEVPL